VGQVHLQPDPSPTQRGESLNQDRCDAVARRLRSSFTALVNSFPEQAATVSEMSRFLGVGRAVCQRIVLALRSDAGSADILQRFPGVRGLEQFLDAAESRKSDTSHLAAARAAVDEYAALIGAAGGSQRRLLASLAGRSTARSTPRRRESSSDHYDDEATARRAAFFDAAQSITGNRSQARIETMILRVKPDDPQHLEYILASGHVGATADAQSTPIARVTIDSSGEGDSNSKRTELATKAPVLGISPGSILREFSTNPLPTLVSRASNAELVQIFNPEGRAERPLDIIIGAAVSPASKHPALDTPALFNAGMVIGMPTRWLLMDVYLERSLARQCTPQMGVIRMGFGGPLRHHHPDERWYDRLPDDPSLELLGPGLARKPSRAYPRATELAAHLLQCAGWAADQFICFRCEVQFPIWETEYVMTFNFEEPRPIDVPEPFRRA